MRNRVGATAEVPILCSPTTLKDPSEGLQSEFDFGEFLVTFFCEISRNVLISILYERFQNVKTHSRFENLEGRISDVRLLSQYTWSNRYHGSPEL